MTSPQPDIDPITAIFETMSPEEQEQVARSLQLTREMHSREAGGHILRLEALIEDLTARVTALERT